MKKILIIGAGASGIMAAIIAASNDCSVTVLEQNSKPLKKLLATGNGRCNLTNKYWDDGVLRSHHHAKACSVINNFPYEKTLDFFHSIGIQTKDRNGWVYPITDSAANVAKLLIFEAEQKKVKIKTNEEVIDIKTSSDSEHKFTVYTKSWHYEADAVIISCGSPASLEENTANIGIETAQRTGLKTIDFSPALVFLKSSLKGLSKWSGVRTEGSISLFSDNVFITEESGELQLTETGISGIPVFRLSRYAVDSVINNKNTCIFIDFLPEYTESALKTIISEQITEKSNKPAKLLLMGLLNEKLAEYILSAAKVRNITSDSIDILIKTIKHFRLPITGFGGIDRAQVCQGGVSLDSLTDALEAKTCEGLYFIGETVDVDGTCGGYNLQWAWSSAYTAARDCSAD